MDGSNYRRGAPDSLHGQRGVAEAAPEITTAVIAAIQKAISQSDGGHVVIINDLTVNIQINAAHGGGATVSVTNN